MRILLIFSLLILSLKIYGQNPSLKTDSSYQSNQPRVVVFNTVQKKKKKEQLNILKINLISPLSGDMVIHFERKIADKISFEVGPGVTLKNYLTDLFNDNSSGGDIERVYKLGYSFNANLRYYPGGAIEEFYFSPDVRVRKYNSEANIVDDIQKYQEYTLIKDFKLNFGYVNFIDSDIIIEYYAGIGIRQKTTQTLTYNTNSTTNLNVAELKKSDSMLPLISFGLKFGFAF